jgi:hypothetical protein
MRELTKQETKQSERGPGFVNVKPSDIFGKTSSFTLSQKVRTENPRRWYELQQEWRYLAGIEARPDSFWG